VRAPRYYRTKRALGALVRLAGRVPGLAAWSERRRVRLRSYGFTDNAGYYAQWGQDQFVDQIVFREQRGGTFVDIGANDGVALSNTYFLETVRGWTGLCVEPQPTVFAALRAARRCDCVEGCAATSDGEAAFTIVDGVSNVLSGRPDVFPDGHAARIAESVRVEGGLVRSIIVRCYEVNALIRRHGLTSVDFLSIDTEGGEAELLAAIDLDRFRVRAIAIENNYADRRIERALDARGYDFAAWMGSDEIYVRRS